MTKEEDKEEFLLSNEPLDVGEEEFALEDEIEKDEPQKHFMNILFHIAVTIISSALFFGIIGSIIYFILERPVSRTFFIIAGVLTLLVVIVDLYLLFKRKKGKGKKNAEEQGKRTQKD